VNSESVSHNNDEPKSTNTGRIKDEKKLPDFVAVVGMVRKKTRTY